MRFPPFPVFFEGNPLVVSSLPPIDVFTFAIPQNQRMSFVAKLTSVHQFLALSPASVLFLFFLRVIASLVVA